MRPVRGARLLRAALRHLGDGSADPETARLRGQILVSLAYAEAEQGHVDEGWRMLAEAESLLPPERRGLVMTQRALLFVRTGRDEEAIAEYDRALSALTEEALPQPFARALLNRGNLHLSRGHVRAAREDLLRCADVSTRNDLDRILPLAVHGLGYLDYLVGDLPAALHTYSAVAEQYAVVKPGVLPVLALDRARALIAAGLYTAADEQLAFALAQFRRHRLQQDHAEAQLARAEAALLAGDAVAARRWASRARAEFLRRGNQRWAALATLVALRSRRWTSAHGARALIADAGRLADSLSGLGLAEDARLAVLVGARAQIVVGDCDEADRVVRRRAMPGRADRLDTRLLWRLVRAETAVAHGRRADAAHHLAAGMVALQQYRSRMGCLDLQTGAAVHGRDLASAGIAVALASGSAATVYRWAERSRAQALLLPPAAPPEDRTVQAVLEELRHVRQTLREAEIAGRPAGGLRGRATHLESTVREHAWATRGRGLGLAPASFGAVRAELGDTAMVIYIRDGPRLNALVLAGRRPGRVVGLGAYAWAAEVVYRLRADLDTRAGRLLPDRLAAAVDAATRTDAAIAAAAMLDPVLPLIGDRDLVVVPTGALVTVPWSVYPDARVAR
jgi:tetratricopeptide (TPR) repeat protein